jgi:hypothetical protein
MGFKKHKTLEVLFMKKVSIEIAKAFISNKDKKLGNTYTKQAESYTYNGVLKSLGGLFLHDNKIAWWDNSQRWENEECTVLSNSVHLCFSMCGWDTPTTRERLNTLFYELFSGDAVFLKQSKGNQYLYINNTCMEIDPSKVYILREIGDDLFLDEPVAQAIDHEMIHAI